MSAGQEPGNKGHDKAQIGDGKQAILAKLDFRGFYSRYLKAGDAFTSNDSEGWTNRVHCPIHEDRKDPNFFINVTNGSFKCHACGSGGSVFDFWLLANGYNVKDKRNFPKALDALAVEAGVNLKTFHRKKPEATNLPAGATEKTDAAPKPEIPKHNKADQTDKTTDPIKAEVVDEMIKALRRDHFVYLNTKRGLKKKTIDENRIGFDVDQIWKDPEAPPNKWERGRYSIPIPNKVGEYRNIRMYAPGTDPAYKMINYVTGKNTPNERKFGAPPRLFNLHKLVTGKYDNIVFVEGEWDCMLLNQFLEEAGYHTWLAVTGTHGANTFEPEWLEYLYGKHVYFCFDCDEAGKAAQLEHVNKYFLRGISTGKYLSVRMVELPLDGSKENKDISDYFLKGEFSCEEFIKLCLDTPDTIGGGITGDEGTGAPIEVNDFIAAIKDRRYIDQRVTVPISISGTTSKVYHAIRTYAVTRCPVMDKKEGDCCSTFNTERIIPYGHSLFIEACMERERNILQAIAGIACQHGQKCSIQPVTKVVMEEYFAHQVVQRWRSEEDMDGRMQNAQELVQTSVYVLQPPQNITINPQNYMATGYIRTHPKTGIATFFIEQMVPMEEDWRKFTVESVENQHMLKTLRDDFSVDDIMNDLRNGVTQIYEMDEILLSVLLTYLTPLWIHFNGRLERGWVNVAIIGDTGTGKSATYMRFSDWVELGDLFSALSGTRTGLLYSIKKKNDEWHVQIGRYVQASGKIIAVDETQETTADDIKRMAVAMDTGYLKVDQVASGGYHSETRTLFLMNPKNYQGEAATISDFTFGCDALRMCFHPMFIRRLDLALFTTGRQTYELYNQAHKEKNNGKIRLTPRMMRTLIYWAWTRTADQIEWTQDATNLCLETATLLSKDFGDADQVPLVNPQDFRVKLARLSTAFAILSRSFSDDLERLIVKPEHVQTIANFIDRIYSMPACNLKHRSRQAKSKNSMEDFDSIQKAFEGVIIQASSSTNVNYRQGDYFVRMLLFLHTMHKFRKRDLAEQLSVNINWVSKRVTILQGYNMIDVAQHGGYKTTKKFNLFMQRWLQNPEIAQIFEQVQERVGRQAFHQADDALPGEPSRGEQIFEERYNPNYYNNDPFDAATPPIAREEQ
jgi:hypothetical protein